MEERVRGVRWETQTEHLLSFLIHRNIGVEERVRGEKVGGCGKKAKKQVTVTKDAKVDGLGFRVKGLGFRFRWF